MKLLNYALSLFPSRLPVGVQEFDKWAASIRALVGPGFEQVPDDDFKFVLANNILHLGPQRNSAPKNYFVRTIRKGAANQIASQVFQQVKVRQKAAEEAAKTATQPPTLVTPPAEVTAQPAGATDGQTKAVQTSNS